MRGRLRQLAVAAWSRTNEWSMVNALRRARAIDVRGVVDVGASDGSWARQAQQVWPLAQFLLIEAQAVHELALRRTGFQFVIAAAGFEVGEVHFDARDPWGGVASRDYTGDADIIVPMTTIDEEVARTGLPGPYLVKLDTHGFEREILAGARKTIAEAAMLVIEAYNFQLRPGSYRFHELVAAMEADGFRCLDLADPMHRQRDSVLWQLDLVFARAEFAAFSSNAYGA